MKKLYQFLLLTAVAFSATGCLTTSLITMAALSEPTPTQTVYVQQPAQQTVYVQQPASQSVYVRPATTTTTIKRPSTSTAVQVTSTSNDISLYLDLQAVGAAFLQASSVEQFERMLNSSSYMINNLDLNRDGYIDYLRVLETYSGYNHTYLIQACLAANIFQDVATLTAEVPYTGNKTYVQVIGSPYIYGANYIVEPCYSNHNAPIFVYLRKSGYRPWSSPYYYGCTPSYYSKPVPVYLSHYQAYIQTYMQGHKYVTEVRYPTTVHYTNYSVDINIYTRNDYAREYPQNSFTNRNTGVSNTHALPRPATNTINSRHSADSNPSASTSTSKNTGSTTTNKSTGSTSATSANTTSRHTADTTPAGNTNRPSVSSSTTVAGGATTRTSNTATASTSTSAATTTSGAAVRTSNSGSTARPAASSTSASASASTSAPVHAARPVTTQTTTSRVNNANGRVSSTRKTVTSSDAATITTTTKTTSSSNGETTTTRSVSTRTTGGTRR